jgi:hypothetical protein
MQRDVSFLHPIIWDRPAFSKRFPRFSAWLTARRAASTARNGLPLPRSAPTWPPQVAAAQRPTLIALPPLAWGSKPRDADACGDGGADPDAEAGLSGSAASARDEGRARALSAAVSLSTEAEVSQSELTGMQGAADQQPSKQVPEDERTTGGPAHLEPGANLGPGARLPDVVSEAVASPPTRGSAASAGPAAARAVVRRPVSRRRQVRRMPSLSSTDDEPPSPSSGPE